MFDSVNPFVVILILISLGLAPFLLLMISSFVKIVVVFSLIRNALGLQQVPPNMVVNGLALILTIYIMAPIIEDTSLIVKNADIDFKEVSSLFDFVEEAAVPIKNFLNKHTDETQKLIFLKTAKKIWPKEKAERLDKDNIFVLIPAFVISELTKAFQIGFILFLPFLVVDLIVSNLLLALGMMMMSPMMISLPLKILLFVVVSGWNRLIEGLLLSYQ